MDFDVSADDDIDRGTEYSVSENFLEDFVRFSRSNQVLNEVQSSVVQMAIATGLMSDYEFFTSIIVTGGSSGGKSHMLNEVNFEALEYANAKYEDYVYELTGGSDKAGVDDEAIDDSLVAYFHELQKIPDEMLEFIKTISEDGQFKYGRNVPDPDKESGRDTVHIERDPLPVVFSFADENQAAAGKDQELRTRTVEVKVDEDPEKNRGVHDMKWGGNHITLPDSEHEYIFEDPELEHAVKAHLRDMPIGVDVVMPYGDGKFEGDDWCAAEVVRPMFNFARSESTRASALLAGLTMGSAIMNHHERDAACLGCGESYEPADAKSHGYECPTCDDRNLHIVVGPQDVGNLIACRDTLLATTHGLTEKKFAVIDAILERGGQANASGTAVHATKQDIITAIQENDNLATLTKSEIKEILEELDENLIINKKDNPEDRRENLFEYDGRATFKSPNIYEYYDRFEHVTDPIRDQPIEHTVDQQLEDLNAKMETSSVASAGESAGGAESGLGRFSGDDEPTVETLPEPEQAVAERLADVMDDRLLSAGVMKDNSLRVEHMIGVTPTIEREDDKGVYVEPSREPSGSDKVDGIMSPDHDLWAEGMDFNDVDERVNEAFETLRGEGVLKMVDAGDGDVRVEVEA